MAVPLSAKSQPGEIQALFEADIFDPFSGRHSFTGGQVYVRTNGAVKVEIEGVVPAGQTYSIWLIYGPPDARVQSLLGLITTDGDSDGALNMTFMAAGITTGTQIRNPVLVINMGWGPLLSLSPVSWHPNRRARGG